MNRTSIPIFILGILIGVACLFVWQSAIETDEDAVVISRTEQNTCAGEDVDSDSGEVAETKKAREAEPPLSADLEDSSPDRTTDSRQPATITPDSDIEPEAQGESVEEALSLEEVKKSLSGFSDDELEDIKDEIDKVIKERKAGPKKTIKAKLSGIVVDALGNPIPYAGIYVELDERAKGDGPNYFNSEWFSGKRLATADSSGVWSMEVTESIGETSKLEVGIVAKAKNYANSKRVLVVVGDEDVKVDLEILIRGYGSVKGRVVDQYGSGVEGVGVGLDIQEAGAIPILRFRFNAYRDAITDSEGYYRFKKLTEGNYKFSIAERGIRINSGPSYITVKPNQENISKIDYVVSKIRFLRFALTSENKQVYGSATIVLLDDKDNEIYSADEWVTYSFSSSNSSEHPKFSRPRTKISTPVILNEPPTGAFRLRIEMDGFKTKTVTCTISGHESTDLGEITLVEVDDD